MMLARNGLIPGIMEKAAFFRAAFSIMRVLEVDFYSGKTTARKGRAVDVARIAFHSLVKIFLIGIEDILYSGIDLQGNLLVNGNVVRNL